MSEPAGSIPIALGSVVLPTPANTPIKSKIGGAPAPLLHALGRTSVGLGGLPA
jgi:hypothetical protein